MRSIQLGDQQGMGCGIDHTAHGGVRMFRTRDTQITMMIPKGAARVQKGKTIIRHVRKQGRTTRHWMWGARHPWMSMGFAPGTARPKDPQLKRDRITKATRRMRLVTHPDRFDQRGMSQALIREIHDRAVRVNHAAEVLQDIDRVSK